MTRMRTAMEKRFTTELFAYPKLRSMFLTLALDQFFIILMNVLSASMVSSVGEAAIAAVSMVGVINAILYGTFGGMAAGGGIIIARAKGAGDKELVRRAIATTTTVTLLTSAIVCSTMIAFAEPVTNFLYPTAEPLLIEYSVEYMRLMLISAIPFGIFNALFTSYRSLGDTRTSLIQTIIINGVHLFCSILYINVLDLGVTGAGLSYLTARIVGTAAVLLWQLKLDNPYGVRFRDFFHPLRSVTKSIFSLGAPIAMETGLMQGGMLIVQVYLARLTTSELAAHAVSNSIINLVYTIGNAVTALASTVCGQCFGAGNPTLLKTYCIRMVRAGRVILLVTVLVLAPFMPLWLILFKATDTARPIILTCLGIAAVASPIFWCDSYVPSMALRSAGDSVYTTVVSVVSLFIGRCAVGYILTITLGLGVPGVWLGMALEWLIRGLALRLRMAGKHWLHKSSEQHV